MDTQRDLARALAASRAAALSGDMRTAVHQATLALGLAEQQGNEPAAAEAATWLTQHHFQFGRFESALSHGHRALAAWRKLQRPERECELLTSLAACCAAGDRHADALVLARTAFDLSLQHTAPRHLLASLVLLGALHGRAADPAGGEALLMQALTRAREHAPSQVDAGAEAGALSALLCLLIDTHAAQSALGDAPLAAATAARLLHFGRQALALCSEQTDTYLRVTLRSDAAVALLVNGWLDDARALLRSCVQLARAEGFRAVELKARQRLAGSLLADGLTDDAVAELRAMQADLQTTDEAAARLDNAELLARIADRLGQHGEAARYRAGVAALAALRQQQQQVLEALAARGTAGVREALEERDAEALDSRSGVPSVR